MNLKYIYSAVLSMMILSVLGQSPKPGDAQEKPMAITNVTIHIGNGAVVNNGTVVFEKGMITQVGESAQINVAEMVTTIDGTGKHIYPGLIMPATRLGLEEVGAVRATRDYQEVGAITPHVRSQIAYNADSEILPTYRFNGILTAQVTPSGGFVTGTSSVMSLDAWNWEDATLKVDDAIHVNWPEKSYGPRWWMGETARRPNENYDKQVAMILDLFDQAVAYHKSEKSPINLKLEAVKGVIEGTQKVFLYADNAATIVDGVTQMLEKDIVNLVLVGGEDAYYVRALLVDNNIPVILDNIHRAPAREDEPIDWPYRLPTMLQEAGVKVTLRHAGMLARGRNLPFYAGTVAAYGMSEEDAVKMITLNAAEVLGVDDMIGSIETGKHATLIICTGNILDMRSSMIERAFIQGRDVSIEGKQQVLYERFKAKYSK
ncbi:MAG: imidazolonepropionase-like amidohydrolase [Cyclobacteriaceae bacterium]|jgi:imidazolonepropionase-like amidohydrolase